MILVVFYQIVWTCYRTFVDNQKFLVTSLAIVEWYLQAFFSMLFCVYWQAKGHLQDLLAAFTAHRLQMGGESSQKDNRMVGWIFGSCVGGMVAALFGPLYLYYFGDLQTVYLNVNLMEAFGRGTGPLGLLVCGYCLFVGIFVMHAYVFSTLMAHRKFVQFNEQLKTIGTKDESRAMVAGELVYAFVMLGTAIPTVIFTIVTFIQRLRHGAYFSAAFMTTGFSLCIVELIALTFTPAKIHTTAREVEAILFENKRIWIPFHDAAYQTAALLIAHANQSSLGVSAWGFVLLSKPLILSVVSLTVTYLVLLIQMGREEGIE
ncbi:hypothetical protein M3Y99_01773700 [Aphelenchoides fujianensis]|nr:hypothetical protein M3Y99_01773700 [Aphelenchoides fujianensis]